MLIASWNMCGAAEAGGFSKWSVVGGPRCGAVDVFCLQECGGRPAEAKSDGWFQYRNPFSEKNVMSYTWATSIGTLYITHLEQYSDPNARCNIAILSKQRPLRVTQLAAMGSFQHRPALAAEFKEGWVFSIHAASGNGNDCPGLVNAAAACAGASDWIIGGDFNCDPDKSRPAARIRNDGYFIASSGYLTHPQATRESGPSELDYFVSKRKISAKPKIEDLGHSDHNVVNVSYFD